MRKDVFNIRIEYKPFNTYKNVLVLSGSSRQSYNANTRYFEPDRRIDPYVVSVECGVNDVHGIVTGLVNANLTDVSWKMSSSTGYKEIESTNNEFRIGTGADKGKLTIFKNVSDIEAVTILFTARFYDATTKRTVNFQESFNLVTLPVAQAPILLETSAPVGLNLYPTENNQGLLCQADLYQGAEVVPAAYWWYKGNTLLTDANGYQGTAKNKLFVPAAEISKIGDVYKCEVSDCSEYFNGLVQQKVEADTEVVEWRGLFRDLPENLLKTSSPKIIHSSFGGWNLYLNGAGREDIMPVLPGELYVFRVYYENVTDVAMSVRFIWHDSEGGSFRESVDGNVINVGNSGYSVIATYVPLGVYYVSPVLRSRASQGVKNIRFKEAKLEKGNIATAWSPSKSDIQNLVNQKTTEYKSQTSLPNNYRPSPKPSKLYKGDFMLMKKLPQYEVDILYPTTVSPDATSVQVEMVLTTNNGVIPNPDLYFSVGWLKNTDGTFKYKGFKVNISIVDIQALNTANKQLDYELREDLTLKV